MRITSGKSYQSRAWFLKQLGFASYRDYLASPLWSEIREKVFSVKGRSCYLCGEKATQAHHTRYHRNDLLGKKLRNIQPICGKCHETIEFKDGEKATVSQSKAAFRRLRQVGVLKVKEREESDHLINLLMNESGSVKMGEAWECEAE